MKKDISNKLRKISYCAIFLVILAFILLITSVLITPAGFRYKKYFDMLETRSLISEEKENSIDVLFIGDSLAYSSVSPMEIWKEYGITSYVCATSRQILPISKAYLEQAFETQKPKAVILEANAIYRRPNGGDKLLPRLENLFSVFLYHDRWKTAANSFVPRFLRGSVRDDFKGFVCYRQTEPLLKTDYMKYTDEKEKIDDRNIEFLKEIKELCRENGAQLVLFNAPNAMHWSYKKHNGADELAKNLGVAYFDMNLMTDEISIDWKTDTRDKGDHLNYLGAVKVSKYLGKYLKNTFGFDDRRGDENYADWNEALEKYQFYAQTTLEYLKNEKNRNNGPVREMVA